MPVKSLREHILSNWDSLREALEDGTYQPAPVRLVEIPKPNGGVRRRGLVTPSYSIIPDRRHSSQTYLALLALFRTH